MKVLLVTLDLLRLQPCPRLPSPNNSQPRALEMATYVMFLLRLLQPSQHVATLLCQLSNVTA